MSALSNSSNLNPTTLAQIENYYDDENPSQIDLAKAYVNTYVTELLEQAQQTKGQVTVEEFKYPLPGSGFKERIKWINNELKERGYQVEGKKSPNGDVLVEWEQPLQQVVVPKDASEASQSLLLPVARQICHLHINLKPRSPS
jgi:hypothetical protein